MKFLEPHVSKMYITLIPTTEGVVIYAQLRKNFKIIKHYDKQIVRNKLTIAKVVGKLEREASMSYVALLETTAKQGLLPSCQNIEGIDLSHVEKVCIDNKWGFYISKDALHECQKEYRDVGLDFIFSPYSLMHQFHGSNVQKNDGLAVLVSRDFVLCSVYQAGVMIFAKETMMQERLTLTESTEYDKVYTAVLQESIQAFYDAKIDETMFIEKVYIADAVGFESSFENELEETLFVEVTSSSIDLSHELCILSEMELI